MSQRQSREVWDVVDEAIEVQQRNRTEPPIRMEKWELVKGWISITLGGSHSQDDGNRIIRIVNGGLRYNGQRLRAQWNHQLPRVARLTIKAGRRGDPSELIEDEGMGIVRLNEWPEAVRGQVRYISTIASDVEDPDHRLIRFEASPEVVRLIQDSQGSIWIGRYKGTVQSGKKNVKHGSPVKYYLQK